MLPVTDSIGCIKLGKRAAKRSKCAAKAPGTNKRLPGKVGSTKDVDLINSRLKVVS